MTLQMMLAFPEADLCMALMRADTEKEVIALLVGAGYWNDPAVWRLYGDNPNNYSTIGNQQSRSDAALVEKVVNAVDARLVNACLERGIVPESDEAPRSIREAVSRFFEGTSGPLPPDAGKVRSWPPAQRTKEARLITLSATGLKPEDEGYPSITVADQGEGQTPSAFPRTFLSLNSQNKLRVHFVQGKFNMGGTGALQFCGHHNLQLIVSRRNPAFVDATASPDDFMWGFTVVRREYPDGDARSSSYSYLAPLGSEGAPRKGEVLRFRADTWPIFPEGQDAYARMAGWGSLLKLYEYELRGYRSNIVSAGAGLLRRLDVLLPEVALPIRVYECRPYRGHKGSFETNVTGVNVRLDDDRAENLEPGFPTSAKITTAGEPMNLSIYAFKKGKAEGYRMQQGVLFSINGQAHGHFPTDFFKRKSVGMSYLADSLLVLVDCSEISGAAREDLFMNSRDRLRDNELKELIEGGLEDLLKNHPELRELANRRRQEEIAERLEDSKPLEEVLETLLQQSPTLRSLFLLGKAIPNPFAPERVRHADEYEGKRFPTFFRFQSLDYGKVLDREASLGTRPRITFETDAANDYFSRDLDRGEMTVERQAGLIWEPVMDYTLNLSTGLAYLNCPLPPSAGVGDVVAYRVVVTDVSRLTPFENQFSLRIAPPPVPVTSPSKKRRKPRGEKPGADREAPTSLALPNIYRVTESDWLTKSPPFTKTTALRVKNAGAAAGGTTDIYDFYVNVDNLYLKAEQKASSEPQLVEQRFVYGLVLVGLAILQDSPNWSRGSGDDGDDLDAYDNIEEVVEHASRALAPVVLPMIESLGALTLDAD